MTSLLEEAAREVAQLPESEQVCIDRLVLDEIEDQARWQSSFEQSEDKLAALANAAREEIARGEVRDQDSSTASE